MLKKAFVCTCTLALGFNALNADSKQAFEGLSAPESVFVKCKDVFVSNINGGGPLAKDGDGYISKFDKKGRVKAQKFIENLNAPKGLNAIGNTLYVADIDRVLGFDMKKGKKLFELVIDDAKFLNAIEAHNDFLYISDTGTGKIHKFDVKTNEYETFITLDSKLGGPNGLLIVGHNLFVVGYDPNGKVKGAVVAVNLKTKEQSVLVESLGDLDGVVLAKDKKSLLVSSWGDGKNGVIYKVPLSGLESGEILKADELETLDLPAMAGPADMYRDGKKLYIPKMLENALSVEILR